VAGGGRVITPVLVQQTIDRHVTGGPARLSAMLGLAGAGVALILVAAWAARTTNQRLATASERALCGLRVRAFNHIHALSMAHHTEEQRGALVARVLYRKHRSAGRMLVVDTGMHHLLRPALYQAVHRVRPLRAAPLAGPTEVVGPICESTDVLTTDADLPDLAPGDLVAFLDAGAYGMTMASNYNGQPRPAEIVVSDGVARVARRRETWEELLAAETEAGAPVAAAQGPASPLGW